MKCPKCNYQWDSRNRSRPQNSSYWCLIVTPFAEHLGYTVDECHDLLKENCSFVLEHKPDRFGKMREIKKIISTTGMTTVEFMEYEARCRIFANTFGVYCQEPGEQIL